MGVHAKGHCGKYRIQTKYTFNRCQQKFTLLILCTQKPQLSRKQKDLLFLCVGYTGNYVNYENNI